jgi:GxxExxY protein
MHEDILTGTIVNAALKVHSRLGPGLLESVYEACLVYELSRRGFAVRQQVPVAVVYEDIRVDVGYRADVLVNDSVVLELKSVEKLLPIHSAQLLSYLRLGRYRLGLLLNFNTIHMRHGVKRLINGYADSLHEGSDRA